MGRFVHTLHRQVGRLVDHLERPVPRSHDVQPPGSDVRSSIIPLTIMAISRRGAPAVGVRGPAPAVDFAFAPSDIDVLDPPSNPTLPEVEDGRLFNFDSAPPLRSRSGSVVRLRAATPVKGAPAPPHGIAVETAVDTVMCIRRKSRRGVILALGQGGGFHRPPRRSPKSDLWCE